ncbi:flagellar motor component MotA [Bradyrhizobium sp. USDA 4011]
MSQRFFTTTGSQDHGPDQRSKIGIATVVLLIIGAIAGGGGFLSHLIEPPKAIFLILLAMFVWSVGGWFLGGWQLVLAGLAALAAALAASNGDYVLSVALSVFLFVFLSTHLHVVDRKR